ncbi:MAG TPA: malto-oligosyltrehalose synthase [Myxococcales bacterium]|nr:malto-oligosyltrehalose synthase [Myxococcales bacterium]
MRLEREIVREQARSLLDEVAGELAAARQPVATYRVQLHKGFPFDAAAAVLPYLAELGITDLYTSPILQAAPGSMHGYDVIDHGSYNAELGGEEGYERLASALRGAGLGHVLDIVPNHMGLGAGNALWMDLLENGPSARAAKFFDVEWRPVKEELSDKVLLPVLGDRYGAVLERGEIQLDLDEGAFLVRYYDHLFPLNPRSYPQILAYRIEELEKELGKSEAVDELKSVLFVLEHMPSRHEQDPARREERWREKEVVKRRVATLLATSEPVRRHLAENVRIFNGTKGKPRSFDLLDKLLDAQAYRLAHWRVSSEEINYRRFFDINSLAAVRMEDPEVFEQAHRLPLRLLAQGKINGLRIDHPDGLAYPRRYFGLLQDAHILQRARSRAEGRGLSWDELEPAVRHELAQSKDLRLDRPLYVVAEKILARTETLPGTWAVAGTTGYDFLNSLNGIFVARENAEKLQKIYARFIHGEIDFQELVYQKKKLILYTAMASEMNLLARQLNRISEGNRWTRDFTLYALRSALIEMIACFPVYRSYIEEPGHVDERDRKYILEAVACAKRRNPAENASIYTFIADILLQKFAAYVEEGERPAQHAFAVKLQQVLGPVMAKGLEDTAFYVYNRLVSLNEVGGEPEHFGSTIDSFHQQNRLRAQKWPGSLLATATHDTKRGEDIRVRIDALSEVPEDWRKTAIAFARRTEGLRREVDGRFAPDRNEQMLVLQTLIGAWPMRPEELPGLRDRLVQYMIKAAKEAKVNTSWIQEDQRWEDALRAYVEGLFALPPRHRLWKGLQPFAQRIAQIGMHNSLAQVVLKIASPGVPDFYQGNELWDLSLVDPDNRRPVDFELRRKLLDELRSSSLAPAELARQLYASWEDGRIKLFLTHAALQARKAQPDVFAGGGYVALAPAGPRAGNLAAFARMGPDGQTAVMVAPRLVAGLLDGARLAAERFAGTVVPVPGLGPGERLRDALTGEERVVGESGLAVDQLFSTLPVALLTNSRSS